MSIVFLVFVVVLESKKFRQEWNSMKILVEHICFKPKEQYEQRP